MDGRASLACLAMSNSFLLGRSSCCEISVTDKWLLCGRDGNVCISDLHTQHAPHTHPNTLARKFTQIAQPDVMGSQRHCEIQPAQRYSYYKCQFLLHFMETLASLLPIFCVQFAHGSKVVHFYPDTLYQGWSRHQIWPDLSIGPPGLPLGKTGYSETSPLPSPKSLPALF